MKLLYEVPELPLGAWLAVLEPTAEVDLEAWLDLQVTRTGAPRKLATSAVETARGWPGDFVTYEAGGRFIVAIVYRFFDLVAALVLGGLPPAWLAQHELEVTAALRAVEPDWVHDDPLALVELWSELA